MENKLLKENFIPASSQKILPLIFDCLNNKRLLSANQQEAFLGADGKIVIVGAGAVASAQIELLAKLFSPERIIVLFRKNPPLKVIHGMDLKSGFEINQFLNLNPDEQKDYVKKLGNIKYLSYLLGALSVDAARDPENARKVNQDGAIAMLKAASDLNACGSYEGSIGQFEIYNNVLDRNKALSEKELLSLEVGKGAYAQQKAGVYKALSSLPRMVIFLLQGLISPTEKRGAGTTEILLNAIDEVKFNNYGKVEKYADLAWPENTEFPYVSMEAMAIQEVAIILAQLIGFVGPDLETYNLQGLSLSAKALENYMEQKLFNLVEADESVKGFASLWPKKLDSSKIKSVLGPQIDNCKTEIKDLVNKN